MNETVDSPRTSPHQPARLSVLVAPRGPELLKGALKRANFEKTLRNLFSLISNEDPLGTEIIAIDDTPDEGVIQYLKEVFSTEMATGKLHLAQEFPDETQRGDWGALINRAADRATGAFLSPIVAGDEWGQARLGQLIHELKGHQLIFSGEWRQHQSQPSDWAALITDLKSVTRSSIVVRTDLFHELGRFPEGYSGVLFPRKVPGDTELEFVLKALQKLMQEPSGDGKSQMLSMDSSQIRLNDLDALPPALSRLDERITSFRSWVSLIRTGRDLPKSYWPSIARRTLRGLFRK